jgi:hypothetical protein
VVMTQEKKSVTGNEWVQGIADSYPWQGLIKGGFLKEQEFLWHKGDEVRIRDLSLSQRKVWFSISICLEFDLMWNIPFFQSSYYLIKYVSEVNLISVNDLLPDFLFSDIQM